MKAPRGRLRWRRNLAGPLARGVALAPRGNRLLSATWGRKVYVHDTSGKLLWSYNCGEDIDTLPAAGPRGEVIFGCGDGTFYSLNRDGEMNFRYPVGRKLASSPAVARDGTVYFGARNGRIYALSRKGKVRWKIKTGDDVDSSPRIARDGVVYAGSDDRHLYAVDPLGNIVWYSTTGGAIRSRPLVVRDGSIYVTAFDQRLWALTRAGALRWTYQSGGQIASSPVAGSDGTVYFGSRDHRLYAVSPEGKLKWSFQTAGEVDSTPVLAHGKVLFGSDDGNLYALNAAGKLAWWFPAGAEVRGALVTSGESIYLGTMDGGLLSVASPGAKKNTAPPPAPLVRWRVRAGTGRVGPVLLRSDGALLVAGSDGTLRAFGKDRWPLWTVNISSDRLNPMLQLDDKIYLTDARGNLACVTADGGLRFRLRLGQGPALPPAAVSTADGSLILVGTRAGRVWAVTTGGKVRWFHSGSSAVTAPPVVLGDQIVVTTAHSITGLDLAGNSVWTRKLKTSILTGPHLAGKVAVVGDGVGQLRAIGPNGKTTWELDLGAGISMLRPAPDGTTLLGYTVDSRVVEVSATGELLLDLPSSVPPALVVPTGSGRDYLVDRDGVVWGLTRSTSSLRRLLDVDSTVLDARAAPAGGLLLAAGRGQIMMVAAKPHNKGKTPNFD